LETASEQEVAHRLLLNHFVPKAWYTRGMEFSEVIRTLGGLDLVLKEDEQGIFKLLKTIQIFLLNIDNFVKVTPSMKSLW